MNTQNKQDQNGANHWPLKRTAVCFLPVPSLDGSVMRNAPVRALRPYYYLIEKFNQVANAHDTLLPSAYAATHSPSCVLFANARTTACTQARCARHGEGKMEKANAFQLQKNKDSNLKSLVNLKHMNRRLSPRPEKVTAKRSIEVDTKKRTRLPNQLHQQAQSIRPRRLSPRAEKVVGSMAFP